MCYWTNPVLCDRACLTPERLGVLAHVDSSGRRSNALGADTVISAFQPRRTSRSSYCLRPQARGAPVGSRHGCLQPRNHGRARARGLRTAAGCGDAVWDFRRNRARAGHRGSVRRHELRSRSAYAGDRHPYGDGRSTGSRSAACSTPGMALTFTALALGWPAAWMLAKLSSSFLYGIKPHDAVTFTLVPAMLVLVALIAAWIPARRAASINPTQALRME